jgi:PIN domain nuclease of toxin-antitoxin system
MARTRESIIFIDTHIVMWLFNDLKNKFDPKTIETIEEYSLKISPIVLLELEYLYEIKRIRHSYMEIYNSLNWSIELEQSTNNFSDIIQKANSIKWTRDVFDRLIVADASVKSNYLLTSDRKILKHYSSAIAPR